MISVCGLELRVDVCVRSIAVSLCHLCVVYNNCEFIDTHDVCVSSIITEFLDTDDVCVQSLRVVCNN